MLALLRGPAIYQDSLNCEAVSELRVPKPEIVAAAGTRQLVNVWPNPAVDAVQIQLTGELAENVVLVLYNVTGQPVLTQNLAEGETIHRIDVQTVPTGLYWLKIRSGQGAIFTGKIIIAR